MGWQSNCHRCGREMPHHPPLTVEWWTNDGRATRHALKCYCFDCAPLILAALNTTASESRQHDRHQTD